MFMTDLIKVLIKVLIRKTDLQPLSLSNSSTLQMYQQNIS
jgi:hypothetical protein